MVRAPSPDADALAVLDWCVFDSDSSSDYGSEPQCRTRQHRRTFARLKFETIGLYGSRAEAMAQKTMFDPHVHKYRTRYKIAGGGNATTYTCRGHKGCDHSFKLKELSSGRFELLHGGYHCGDVVGERSSHGISPAISEEVKSLILVGMGAGKARNLLLFKYMHRPAMLPYIPSALQIANKKAYLKKWLVGGWEITTFGKMLQWAAPRTCQRPSAFHAVDPSNLAAMNDLIVLECFQHEFVDSKTNTTETSLGMVFTSRNCFLNFRDAIRSQEDRLVLSTDGTYRLHFGGWTLVDLGTVCVASENGSYVHRFVPCMYMFVRTECAYAYEQMFQVAIKYVRSFFDLEVVMKTASIDHSDAIASAIRDVWPEADIITCWPHVVRKTRGEISRLVDRDFYEATILPDIRLLHAARSQKQFEALAELVLASWRDSGEDQYASWFDVTYLAPRWCRWHVASAAPGILPSQQPIESHHATIKTIASDNLSRRPE